jgi:CRISPR-associated protein Csb2
MLTLEVELLTGVYRAALPDGSGAEWPPHPERVFSAFAQAWGDSGCDHQERAALNWLERQGAPWIEADRAEDVAEREAPTVFVPPNDSHGDQITVLPERRRRQARLFRAAVPATRIVRYVWSETQPSVQDRAALEALAHRVASLGHSSSLVRFGFVEMEFETHERFWRPSVVGDQSLRVPHEGRLESLTRWYKTNERPRTGATARYAMPGKAAKLEPANSNFGGEAEWFVFEDTGGFRPDLLAFAHVAKRVRDSLMSLGSQPVPEILSGHVKEGTATTRPHVGVVPLANVGWGHATGDLLGFAVVLPRECDVTERKAVLEALAKFAHMELGEGAYAEIHFGDAGVWRLEHVPSPVRASLKPARWCKTACVWASVSPILLDRFPNHGDVIEEGSLISAACRNIGLPDPIEIEIHKHSAVRGAPSAYAYHHNRGTPDWGFPHNAKFANRPRRHVVLRFAQDVRGPVILGAGRFYGVGLCLPLNLEDTQ